MITFKIIDSETGRPVTNVTIVTYRCRYFFQLEGLGLGNWISWGATTNLAETGSISLSRLERPGRLNAGSQIHFQAPGYPLTIFVRDRQDHVISPTQGAAPLNASNEVTVSSNIVLIQLQR